MSLVVQHSAETLHRRKMLSRTWAAIVVAWSLIRTLIVWAALGSYGINPWIYLGIDLISAGVDAFTTPRMVLAFVDDHYKLAVRWLAASAAAFVVPDLYIFLGTRTMPRRVIVIIVAVIILTTLVAIFSVARKVQQGRRAHHGTVDEVPLDV
ncbi:MAG: hypothetical protein ABIQ39_05610 [Ilumatobacteraceae bacterium]